MLFKVLKLRLLDSKSKRRELQDLVKLIDLAGDEKEHEMLLENAYSK